jgi:hypothetical protein
VKLRHIRTWIITHITNPLQITMRQRLSISNMMKLLMHSLIVAVTSLANLIRKINGNRPTLQTKRRIMTCWFPMPHTDSYNKR